MIGIKPLFKQGSSLKKSGDPIKKKKSLFKVVSFIDPN